MWKLAFAGATEGAVLIGREASPFAIPVGMTGGVGAGNGGGIC